MNNLEKITEPWKWGWSATLKNLSSKSIHQIIGFEPNEVIIIHNEDGATFLDPILMTNKYSEFIKGYEGLYIVSIFGAVRSIARQGSRGRQLRRSKTDTGYYRVCLSKNQKKEYKKVHRIVAETFIANPNNKPCVGHIDGNKLNNNVTNLYWCTHKENEKDKLRHGTHQLGSNNHKSILDEHDVREIKRDYKEEGYFYHSPTKIAKSWKLKVGTVQAIVYGKNWKHVIVDKSEIEPYFT